MTARLSPQRETETWASMEDRGAPEPSAAEEKRASLFGFVEAGATEEDLPTFAAALNDYVAAELAAVRAERDALQTRSRRLVEQWNERAETWAPLSSPEKNPEGWERYRTLCSAYCEAADNLHNVLNGFDPDVPWHLRAEREATS